MTSRERVLVALAHQTPDRVPFDCSFTYGAYVNICRRLGASFTEGDDINPYLTFHPSLDVARELGIDLTYIELGRPGPQKGVLLSKMATYQDEWGLQWQKTDHGSGFYFEVRNAPLATAGLSEIRDYPWPDPDDPGMYQALEEKAQNTRKNGDTAIVGKFGAAFFSTASYLRGMENLYVDFLENPEAAQMILSKVAEYYEVVYGNAIARIGKYLDLIRVDNDDFGSQEAPLISPTVYREHFKELHRRFYSGIKSRMKDKNPNCLIMKHSCGSVSAFIPDFMEAGVEILNPLQPRAAGMDQAMLKKAYGTNLCFHGGIDTQHVMSDGSETEIEKEVKRCIGALAEGGGFICAPSHHIQDDVPPDNVILLGEMVRKWGKYPLSFSR